MNKNMPILLLGFMLVLPADSATAEPGRFTMTQTKDGVLRLDTETGDVALCDGGNDGQWSCRPVKDNTAELQRRIRELEQENAAMKAQLAQGGMAAPPASGDNQTGALPCPDGKLDIPSEKDVDRAMDFVERMLKRFQGIMKDLQEQEKGKEEVPL